MGRTLAGWKLLVLCASAFSPSRGFHGHLLNFVRKSYQGMSLVSCSHTYVYTFALSLIRFLLFLSLSFSFFLVSSLNFYLRMCLSTSLISLSFAPHFSSAEYIDFTLSLSLSFLVSSPVFRPSTDLFSPLSHTGPPDYATSLPLLAEFHLQRSLDTPLEKLVPLTVAALDSLLQVCAV